MERLSFLNRFPKVSSLLFPAVLLMMALIVPNCGGGGGDGDAGNEGNQPIIETSEDLAFQYLNGIMDVCHATFNVFTDLSDAGNHFVVLGKTFSTNGENNIELNLDYKTNCHSGTTCTENKFYSTGNNWGGYYFLNGILEGQETQPKLNWGDTPNAGINLSGASRITFWARGANGGERVEFFAFGVGRNAETGIAEKPYPDSSEKVSLGYQSLNRTWTQYSLNVSGRDLTYVLGGFGWVANSENNNNQNITFYMDDIKYDKACTNEPHFLVSYKTIASALEFDTIMRNVAFTYDNALVLIALLSEESADHLRRAKILADALVYAIDHDRFFDDGRLRNGYQGGDLVLFPGWTPNGKADTVRMPGWWDWNDNQWYEDELCFGTHTGNMAWAMIALLAYYNKDADEQYLNAAITLATWIEANRDAGGAGGYTGGFEGRENMFDSPLAQTRVQWKSTEHNIDVYVAFTRLFEITGDSVWQNGALHAKSFVEAMWDDTEGRFWTGTLDDGVTIDTEKRPADVNTWGLMALGNLAKYGRGITWVENNCYVQADGYRGFDFNDDKDHVWFEGTAHMVIGYQILSDSASSEKYLAELERSQTQTTNADGKGIPAASYDGLTTGFDWIYYNRLHIGATAWFLFAKKEYNPYWGIKTNDTIPYQDD